MWIDFILIPELHLRGTAGSAHYLMIEMDHLDFTDAHKT